MIFNIQVKTGAAERKKMEEEAVTSLDYDADLKEIQVLWKKS
jgi:hypothetical protein